MQLVRKQGLRVGLAWSALVLAVSATAPARASTPSYYISELITPAGWEIHSVNERCAWRDVSSSAEIVTPAAWVQRSGREEPSWNGGCSCSDLVIPLEWGSSVKP